MKVEYGPFPNFRLISIATGFEELGYPWAELEELFEELPVSGVPRDGFVALGRLDGSPAVRSDPVFPAVVNLPDFFAVLIDTGEVEKGGFAGLVVGVGGEECVGNVDVVVGLVTGTELPWHVVSYPLSVRELLRSRCPNICRRHRVSGV